MKRLFGFYLFFLCLSFSLQAMEEVHIVPFNYLKHAEQACTLFLESFPLEDRVNRALIEPEKVPGSHVIVAEYQNTLVGFAIYNQQVTNTAIAFSDVFPNFCDVPLKVCNLNYIAVDSRFKRNGIGSKLIKHIETVARENNDYLISLISINNSRPFYAAHNFIKTTPGYWADYMAKPLNEVARLLLPLVVQLRTTDRSSHFGPYQHLI